METIHKYPLAIDDYQIVKMPIGARILKVGEQAPGTIFIWALVNPDMPLEDRHIHVFGTGHEVKTSAGKLKFLDTVIQNIFVWHVFERASAWE